MSNANLDADKSFPVSSQTATKFSVIDHELNRHGMGSYQWAIWAICGAGYFLDVMWLQAVGLATPNIQRELGFSDREFGNITIALSVGITVGGFVWGILVDIVGRRVAFLGTLLIAGVFGMFLGVMSSYNGLLVIMVFTGFGIGGNVPIDSTIVVEYLPKHRFYLLTALSIFVPLGSVISTLIAFGLIPSYSCSEDLVSCRLTAGVQPCCARNANMGWRYLFFTLASITLGVFIIRFFIFPFHESPIFLISKGNVHRAVEVVRKIAAFNKHPCDLTVESFYERCGEMLVTSDETSIGKRLVSEMLRLKLLFGTWKGARVTILVWITWMFDYWGFVISNAYMPIILQRKNSTINVDLKQTYIVYLIIYGPGIAATALSVLMVRTPLIGRKWTLVMSSLMMGVSIFLFSIVNTQASNVGFSMLEIFFQCFFNAALFGWTPEAFPTSVRGTATGLATFFGNLFGIIGPLIAEQLFARTDGNNVVLYLAGSGVFVCTLSLICLPEKDMLALQ